MALTEQEINILKQVKEQGWTKEEALDILKQVREKKSKSTQIKWISMKEAPIDTTTTEVKEVTETEPKKSC